MLNSDNRNLLYTCIFTLIMLIIICSLYGFRKHIFYRKNSSSSQSLSIGSGYYSEPISLGCITKDNLCNTPGQETLVSKCIPNPETGAGCMDEDTGTMTFKTKVQTRECSKQCIKTGFSIQRGVDFQTFSEAQGKVPKDNELKQIFTKGTNKVIDPYTGLDYTSYYFGDYNIVTQKYDMKVDPVSNYPICIPKNLKGYTQNKYICSNNDESGINLCDYMCGVEKTISMLGSFEGNTASTNILLHYPNYVQDNGEKFYVCYDQLGNNLLEGIYNVTNIDRNFVYPNKCYTKYITNFNEYGKALNSITYSTQYITLSSTFHSAVDTFDISYVSEHNILSIPSSWTDKNDGNLLIAKVGLEFMKIEELNSDVSTVTELGGTYFLYSKTEIPSLELIDGIESGEFTYVYKLTSSNYENIKVDDYDEVTGAITFANYNISDVQIFFDDNCNILTVSDGVVNLSFRKIGNVNPFICYKLNINVGKTGDSFITRSLLIKDNLASITDISDVSYEGEYNTEVSIIPSQFLTSNTESISIPYSVELIFGGWHYPYGQDSFTLLKHPQEFEIFVDISSITTDAVILKVDRGFPDPQSSLRLPHKIGADVIFMHNFAELSADFTELMSPYIVDADGNTRNGCYDEYNKARSSGYKLKLQPGETIISNVENDNFNLDYTSKGYDSPLCGVYGTLDDNTNIPIPPFQSRTAYSEVNILENVTQCIISSDEEPQPDSIDNMFKLGISNVNVPNTKKIECFSGYVKGASKRICKLPNNVEKYDAGRKYDEGEVVFLTVNDSQFYLSTVNNNTSELSNANKWKEVNYFNSVLENMNAGEYFVNKKPNVLRAIEHGNFNEYSWDIYNVETSGLRTYDPSDFFTPYLNRNIYFPPKLVDVKLDLSNAEKRDEHYPFSSMKPSITKPFYMEMFVNKLIYSPTDIDIEKSDDINIVTSTAENTWRKYTVNADNFNFVDPTVKYIGQNYLSNVSGIDSYKEDNSGNWNYGLRFDVRPDMMYNNSMLTITDAIDRTEFQIDYGGMRSSNISVKNSYSHFNEFIIDSCKFKENVNLDVTNTSIDDYFRPPWYISPPGSRSRPPYRLKPPTEIQIEESDSMKHLRNLSYGSVFGVHRQFWEKNVDASRANLMNWNINGNSLTQIKTKEITAPSFDLVEAAQTNIGAKEFSQRWYKNLTNIVRMFFWPLYLEDKNKPKSLTYASRPAKETNRSFSSLRTDQITSSVSDLITSAKNGTTYQFNTPTTYNRYFRVTPENSSDIILSEYAYSLDILDSAIDPGKSTYKHKSTFDLFLKHSYVKNSDWWKNIKNENVKNWINSNYNDKLYLVPLFASISMKDDMGNFQKDDANYYTMSYNNKEDSMRILEYKDSEKDNKSLNSVKTFDYFEAFNSIYAKEFKVNLSENPSEIIKDNNLGKTLWGSYSVNQGEFVIGRHDEGDTYRLVMLQKNENFDNLEIYFNYPRAPAVFSIPEIEPLAVTPREYSKIYCYINNIESIYNDTDDNGFIQKGEGVLWDTIPFSEEENFPALQNNTYEDPYNQKRTSYYWNKKYLPFNQSSMQTGYSRLAKSIPGKLAYDGWGARGARKITPVDSIGNYVVNIFLFNLRYNNKLMPIYKAYDGTDNGVQVWYHNYTESETSPSTNYKTDLDGIIDTTDWKSGAKYNLFSIPDENTPLKNSTEWQTYLDNVWTTPGAIYQKNYEFMNIPNSLKNILNNTNESGLPTFPATYQPSETKDSDLFNYFTVPFYWMNNVTTFLDQQLDNNDMTDIIFYNDFIRSVFWGNGENSHNTFMQPYNSNTLFTTYQSADQPDISPTFSNSSYYLYESDGSTLLLDEDNFEAGNYQKSGNSFNPTYTDFIYKVVGLDKNEYNPIEFNLYNPTEFMASNTNYTNYITDNISFDNINVTGNHDNLSLIQDSNTYIGTDEYAANLFTVISNIQSFFPVPLISSYSDIDDNYGYAEPPPSSSVNKFNSTYYNYNETDPKNKNSKSQWQDPLSSSTYELNIINSKMCFQIYNNALVNYLTQAQNRLTNIGQPGAINTFRNSTFGREGTKYWGDPNTPGNAQGAASTLGDWVPYQNIQPLGLVDPGVIAPNTFPVESQESFKFGQSAGWIPPVVVDGKQVSFSSGSIEFPAPWGYPIGDMLRFGEWGTFGPDEKIPSAWREPYASPDGENATDGIQAYNMYPAVWTALLSCGIELPPKWWNEKIWTFADYNTGFYSLNNHAYWSEGPATSQNFQPPCFLNSPNTYHGWRFRDIAGLNWCNWDSLPGAEYCTTVKLLNCNSLMLWDGPLFGQCGANFTVGITGGWPATAIDIMYGQSLKQYYYISSSNKTMESFFPDKSIMKNFMLSISPSAYSVQIGSFYYNDITAPLDMSAISSDWNSREWSKNVGGTFAHYTDNGMLPGFVNNDTHGICYNPEFMSFMLASTYGKAARWPYDTQTVNIPGIGQKDGGRMGGFYMDMFGLDNLAPPFTGRGGSNMVDGGEMGYEQTLLTAHMIGLFHTIHNPYGLPTNVQQNSSPTGSWFPPSYASWSDTTLQEMYPSNMMAGRYGYYPVENIDIEEFTRHLNYRQSPPESTADALTIGVGLWTAQLTERFLGLSQIGRPTTIQTVLNDIPKPVRTMLGLKGFPFLDFDQDISNSTTIVANMNKFFDNISTYAVNPTRENVMNITNAKNYEGGQNIYETIGSYARDTWKDGTDKPNWDNFMLYNKLSPDDQTTQTTGTAFNRKIGYTPEMFQIHTPINYFPAGWGWPSYQDVSDTDDKITGVWSSNKTYIQYGNTVQNYLRKVPAFPLYENNIQQISDNFCTFVGGNTGPYGQIGGGVPRNFLNGTQGDYTSSMTAFDMDDSLKYWVNFGGINAVGVPHDISPTVISEVDAHYSATRGKLPVGANPTGIVTGITPVDYREISKSSIAEWVPPPADIFELPAFSQTRSSYYTNLLVKNDDSYFAQPLFLRTKQKNDDSIYTSEELATLPTYTTVSGKTLKTYDDITFNLEDGPQKQYLRYGFDCINSLQSNQSTNLEGSPVKLDKFSDIKRNKSIIFPIKTFYQIQSPKWDMKTSNYLPTDGAATTLNQNVENLQTGPVVTPLLSNDSRVGTTWEGGFWAGDISSLLGYTRQTSNKAPTDFSPTTPVYFTGTGSSTSQSLNSEFIGLDGKRNIGRRVDSQYLWNTGLHNPNTNQMRSDRDAIYISRGALLPNVEPPTYDGIPQDVIYGGNPQNMGMTCSGGRLEKYTFTYLKNSIPNYERITYQEYKYGADLETNDNMNAHVKFYSQETPEYLPFVYDKNHIEVMANIADSGQAANYVSLNNIANPPSPMAPFQIKKNYDESFKFLQYTLPLNSFTKVNSTPSFPKTSDFMSNNAINFTSSSSITETNEFNFYDTSKNTCTEFLYEPIIISKSQDPYMWNSSVSTKINMALVMTGWNNASSGNGYTDTIKNTERQLFKTTANQSGVLNPLTSYTKIKSWINGHEDRQLGESFDGTRRHVRFVSLYPVREDVNSDLGKRIFGPSQSTMSTVERQAFYEKFEYNEKISSFIGTDSSSLRKVTTCEDFSAPYKTTNIQKLNYKYSDEKCFSFPYYSVTDNDFNYISTDDAQKLSNSNLGNYHIETTVPPSSNKTYQFYNLQTRNYEHTNAAEIIVKDFFDLMYNTHSSTSYSSKNFNVDSFKYISNPTIPKMNVYQNYSNLTGRTFANQSIDFSVKTSYVNPDFSFTMPIVDLKNNFTNKSVSSTQNLAGVTSFLYNNGYLQNNPEFQWPTSSGDQVVSLRENTGFLPTSSPIICDVYGKEKPTCGAGHVNGNWLVDENENPHIISQEPEEYGEISYYYKNFYNNNQNLPPNIGKVTQDETDYLYQKYDEKLKITEVSNNGSFYSRFTGLMGATPATYFTTNLTDSSNVGEDIANLNQETDNTSVYQTDSYKIIAVTDLLDSKRRPYIFQGVNINTSSGAEEDAGPDDPIPIWHRLDIENETIEFDTLLFYECPKIPETSTALPAMENWTTMGRSNFFIDEDYDSPTPTKQLRAKVDATDAWSSVNDLTLYQQPGQLYDQELPAYGCLPMSGGRMVWNELNYNSNGDREKEDKTVSIETRAYNYLNKTLRGTGELKEYKSTKYAMTSSFTKADGTTPRLLYENLYYDIISNTLGVNLSTVVFSLEPNGLMKIDLKFTSSGGKLNECQVHVMNPTQHPIIQPENGTITITDIPQNNDDKTEIIITSLDDKKFYMVINNRYGDDDLFSELSGSKPHINVSNSETIYAVLPLIDGLNKNVLNSLSITGYFPEANKSYGLYVTSSFYNKFLDSLLPREGNYIQSVFNPFRLSLNHNYFFKSNNTVVNANGTISFQYNFYNSNTPNNLLNPGEAKSTDLERDEFYVNAPTLLNTALGFGISSSKISDDVSYIKPQLLTPYKNYLNGLYVLPVSSQTVFTKIGGINFFLWQDFKENDSEDSNISGYMDYVQLSNLDIINIDKESQTYLMSKNLVLPEIVDHYILAKDSIDLLKLFGLDNTSNTDNTYVQDMIKIAKNDIKNFMTNLSIGDHIGIEERHGKETKITYSFNILGIDITNHKIQVQTYFLNEDGTEQSLQKDSKINITSVYTYLVLLKTTLADNKSNRRFIAVSNLSFLEGKVKYNNLDDPSEYTNYDIITPSFLETFDISESTNLVKDADVTLYNDKFNIVFYTTFHEPAKLFDIFGKFSSNKGSSIAQEFNIEAAYRQYQIVFSGGKEKLFFKAVSVVPKGEKYSPIDIDHNSDSNTFVYNTDFWKYYNLTQDFEVKNLEWEPYNMYGINDIVYTDRNITPYINFNESLTHIDNIMYLLPSTYPYNLYVNQNLNLKYYKSSRSFNSGKHNNPTYITLYKSSDTIKDFITNPNNNQELGYMCSADNDIPVKNSIWNQIPYEGCDDPFEIYKEVGGILSFSIEGIIKNNFVDQLITNGAQNWAEQELLPFFNGDPMFITKPTKFSYNGTLFEINYTYMTVSDISTGEEYIIKDGNLVKKGDVFDIGFLVNNIGKRYMLTYIPPTTATSLYYIYPISEYGIPDVKIGEYNKYNTNIQQIRTVGCCVKNKQSWNKYILPDQLSSSGSFFSANPRDMYDKFKSNVSNQAFITENYSSNRSISTSKDVILYFESDNLISNYIPSYAIQYEDIIYKSYFVEEVAGYANIYYYPLYIINNDNLTRKVKTFKQFDVKFYYEGELEISRKKPSNIERFDDIYFKPIIYKDEYPYFLYKYSGETFNLTSSCLYFNENPDISEFSEYTHFKDLLGNYIMAKYDTGESPYFLLSLQNSPCELGSQTEYNSDCNAESTNDIASQVVSFIPISQDSDGKINLGMMNKPLCRNSPEFLESGVEKFDFANSLLLYLVPIPIEYQPDSETIIYCKIMTYFGSQFMGWMKFNRSIEINKDHEIRPLEVGSQPLMSTCPLFVSYDNMNILNTQNQTTILMGDQYIQPRLKHDVTEKQMYYTENYIDEDIFKITYIGYENYNIETLDKDDVYFVVKDIFTSSNLVASHPILGEYSHGINDDYLMAGSSYTVDSSYSDYFDVKQSYLINISGNKNKNGVYDCTENSIGGEIILTRNESFNTYQKLRKNKTVKSGKNKYYYEPNSKVDTSQSEEIYYKLYDSSTDGVLVTPVDEYYTDFSLVDISGSYIVNNDTELDKNGYYIGTYKQTVTENNNNVFKISGGRNINTYWAADTDRSTIVFQDVTNLYNEISALTNRTNNLSNTTISGVEKFTKEKTLAKGMPLKNLKLIPTLKPSSLASNTDIINFSQIRENRTPYTLNNMENDCSMFFYADPFMGPTVIFSYNFVSASDGKINIENNRGTAAGLFENTNELVTTLNFGYKYKFYQIASGMDKVPEFNIVSGENFSLIITYFTLAQIGRPQIVTNNSQGQQNSANEYIKKISQTAEPYIVVEPNKGLSTSPQVYEFSVSYDRNHIQTFTVN